MGRPKGGINNNHSKEEKLALVKRNLSGEAATLGQIQAFKNRTQKSPLDEFVGIIYAKPVTKFTGVQAPQLSYVDLSITSSRIIDTLNMPWSLFSYYNKGNASYCDGHFRSRLYLSNNSFGNNAKKPVSFLTTEDNGILHSGFLLSEFPKIDSEPNENDAYYNEFNEDNMRYEKFACQNIPVKCSNNYDWSSYSSAEKTRGNHRFLSNRTLANKYPYLQNISSDNTGFNGASFTLKNLSTNKLDWTFIDDDNMLKSIISVVSDENNVFNCYNEEGKILRFMNLTYTYSSTDSEDEIKTLKAQRPYVEIRFNDDYVDCLKGDTIDAALVTDIMSFNEYYSRYTGKIETETVSHSIIFEECDNTGSVIGTYKYDVPYITSGSNAAELMSHLYPSTSTCRHIVQSKDTEKVRIVVEFALSISVRGAENLYCSYTDLHGVLVEKNR